MLHHCGWFLGKSDMIFLIFYPYLLFLYWQYQYRHLNTFIIETFLISAIRTILNILTTKPNKINAVIFLMWTTPPSTVGTTLSAVTLLLDILHDDHNIWYLRKLWFYLDCDKASDWQCSWCPRLGYSRYNLNNSL